MTMTFGTNEPQPNFDLMKKMTFLLHHDTISYGISRYLQVCVCKTVFQFILTTVRAQNIFKNLVKVKHHLSD